MKTTPEIIDMPYGPDTEKLFARLRHLPGAIWLDSGKPRSLQGRYDILSAKPLWQLETRRGKTRLEPVSGQPYFSEGSPFEIARQIHEDMGPVGRDYASIPFVGGLMGFFSYDLGRGDHGLPPPEGGLVMPEMRLGWYPWGLVVNHQTCATRLVFHPACPPALKGEIQALLAGAEPAPEEGHFALKSAFTPDLDRREYSEALAKIQHYIQAGDCYQVNFAQPFSATCEGDPWFAYLALRRALPSPFGAFMQWDDKALLCCSPERFLKVSLGQVETKPIKGTIGRGQSVKEDEQNAVQLINSSKDRAENLMIVDLLRNDLGKSCEPGSIHVPKLFALESFANVHHLVSTVTGRLRADQHPLTLLHHCFPGGSITGAPKKRAMEIIDELEYTPREIYCGSVGYLSATGRMDTNIAIRTVQISGGKAVCQGGGGIIADSHPGHEYAESLQKVSLLMRTLESLH